MFVFTYDNTGDNRITVDPHQKYYLPRVKIENYNIEIDRRNFYDQPINDLTKQYDKVRKVSTRQDDDYKGRSLDFDYFGKNYRLIAADFSK